MRSDLVVMPTPCFDGDFRIDSVSEPLHRKTFVAELTVERFGGSVLPRLARFHERGVDVFLGEPSEDRFGDELWAVIRPKCFGCTMGFPRDEPLELLGPSSELVSGVDYTLFNRSRSHFPRIFDWCHVVETLVRPTLVVIDPPRFDLYPCFVNGFKPVHVQALVAQ